MKHSPFATVMGAIAIASFAVAAAQDDHAATTMAKNAIEIPESIRLEPGKRTFHTIIPALMLEDGEPVVAFGTMGGEGQPQTQAALVTRLIDFRYDVQQAIEAPRWLMGRTRGTESHDLWLESRISDETARELRLRGHPVKMTSRWEGRLGHAQAIRIDRKNGSLEGGADSRGDGAAMGY